MRAPITLLLTLSLLAQSLPVFAQEVPVENTETTEVTLPIEETPAPEPVLEPEVIEELPLEVVTFQTTEEESVTYLDISGSIDLPNGCTTTDTSGVTHVFPTATSTEYLAVCALEEAIATDLISEVSLSSSDFGLFVSSLDNIPAGTNEYWAIWINDGYANCGVSCQTLSAGDRIAFVRTAYDPVTYAETPLDRIEITIASLEDNYDNVLVPDACSVTDSSGISHIYPATGDLLGVCALSAALSEGYISGFELTDASFGLYVSSLDNIPAGTNEYWAIWINDGYANCGVSCQTLSAGDRIAFVRTAYDPVSYEETQLERVELRVIGTTHVEEEDEDTGGGTGNEETGFDTTDAFSYLASLQDADGSIENDLVTDWSAIAFATGGAPANAKALLKNYLKTEDVDMDTASDYIRHSMAMLALDLNPYSAGPEDYLTPIVESFDGTQLGEDQYINDDIFALFPLTHAGYSEDDQLIKDIVSFVLSQQQRDGSWAGGVDMTAAAIQALEPLASLPDVPEALTRAEAYLHSKQESDGGFGDVFATTWAVLAIHARGDDMSSWTVSGNDPLEYLADAQNEDGSVETSSGTASDAAWATAYAINAAKGATWNSVLDSVRKQEPRADSSESNTEAKAGEVLGAEDSILPVEATPVLAYEAPAATVAATITPEPQTPSFEEVESTPTTQETPAVTDTESGSWISRMITSFWQGLVDFFRSWFN